MKFHCIYLAAGYSSRYGSNKLTQILKGRMMYRHVLDRLLEIRKEGNLDLDITVVTQYPEIEQDLAGEPLAVAVNPDPSRGVSSSLQTGIASLMDRMAVEEEDFLVFFVADQPGLQKSTIEDFFSALEYAGQPLGCLATEDAFGNPCAFRASYIPDLMKLSGDRGGKKILYAHPDDVLAFDDVDPSELADCDTP